MKTLLFLQTELIWLRSDVFQQAFSPLTTTAVSEAKTLINFFFVCSQLKEHEGRGGVEIGGKNRTSCVLHSVSQEEALNTLLLVTLQCCNTI